MKCTKFQSRRSRQCCMRRPIILKIVIFIRFCVVNGQGLPLQLIRHTNLIRKTTIFKMVPRDTLAYDSEKWSTYQCSFQWCLYLFIFIFIIFIIILFSGGGGVKIYGSCHIHDKRTVYTKRLRSYRFQLAGLISKSPRIEMTINYHVLQTVSFVSLNMHLPATFKY